MKDEYDPESVFSLNANIPPSSAQELTQPSKLTDTWRGIDETSVPSKAPAASEISSTKSGVAVTRTLVSGLVMALLVAVSSNPAGARDPSKTAPICAVLKTSLNLGANQGPSLSADQVFAGEQQTATSLSRYVKKGPAAIRSSLKTLANAYKQLVALGPPVNDQADPTGADTQRAAINQILQDPALLKAINKISQYNVLHLHCNLNP